MSTLANTTWTITTSAAFTVVFSANKTAQLTGPNGQVFTLNWDENSAGEFAIEWPHSTNNKDINIVFAGTHSQGAGKGMLWNFGVSPSSPFTMKKTK